ncbi:hypothetical protein KSP35_13735 [Aquihabitans sp. G128]|uniref:hypothetical protein n=1 Tax=Aquihabitans sp. G128 TaxID=2849779 RepID=UPI001C24D27E|nr:hypothetical protein [Aquihabitans sp. G128]QXC59460.1 hypothetical protein KSP35_13735 [Aquihabitans sp. G128]
MRRRSPLAPLLLAVALVVPLTGCGLFGSDDDAAPPSTTSAAPTSTTQPASQVLDAGAEPRQALRLRFAEGATTTATIRLDLDVSQQSSGHTQALDSPAVVETVRFTVDRVHAGGADLSFTFTDAQVDRTGTSLSDGEHLALTAEVHQLVGVGGTATVTDQGQLGDLSYQLPDDLDPDLAATLDQAQDQLAALAVPLPDEAVGVGARWKTDATSTLAGLEVRTETTYEITAIDGDDVAYTATTEQTADPQPVDLATLPTGTTARLVSSDVTGSAKGTLSLTAPVAGSSSSSKGTQVVDVTRGTAAPVRLTQQLETAVVVKVAG